MSKRAFNFCAGPAALPDAVLQRAQAELLDWRGKGLSVMEMSHRSDDYVAIASKAEQDLRDLLDIPSDYKVLFLQGGASQQFAEIPLNLLPEDGVADYIDTGIWSKKAIEEARRYGTVNVAASAKEYDYFAIPGQNEWTLTKDAAYVHYASNETIGGLEFDWIPETGDVPLVTDMSSDILSRPLDVSRFGLIYAGAQKNIGPSGLVVVIVREDLLGRARSVCPTMLNYKIAADNGSMYNTPATYSWYLSGLVFEWLKEQGGVTAMEQRNRAKKDLLYKTIDASDFYTNPIQPSARSWMNVPFRLADERLDKPFLEGAEARAAQPERPPLGRRHARFHLQRPWPGRGRGAGRIHGGVREGARLMADQDQLKALRLRIDSLDEKLLELISERARCAQDVARVKTQTLGEGEAPVFYRPEREAWVLKHIMQLNKGPLDNEEVARLFREIMSSCLALEQPLKVAYLGPEGTFTQAAALKHFGNAVISTPMAAIDEVFREVAAGAVNFGVVPVENSTEGAVNHTLDSFLEHDMVICGEVELRIHHHLLVGETTKTDNITRIYSHAQSLAQCRKWLDSHYPSVERVAVSSNADAAKRVKSEWNSAAIAGDMAASLYDLSKLHEKIEDRPDNSTRFLIIGNQEVPPTGDDKTSIIVSMRNKPGALHELLVPFHNNGIDLTRIETRPSRSGKWTYVFFIDFVGHHKEPLIKDVLEKIGQEAVALKVLGSYPKAVL